MLAIEESQGMLVKNIRQTNFCPNSLLNISLILLYVIKTKQNKTLFCYFSIYVKLFLY